MKKTSYIFLGIGLTVLSMAFFSSCGEKKAKDGRTDTPTSGTIEFVADESLSPIIDEERSQFEYEFPKAKLKPKYTDEVTGLQMIKDFKTALLFTTRNLKDSEIAYLKSKTNVIPSVFPIGYDGLAFIVNKQNNDTCITVKDIKRILTGKATKWSDIVKGSKRGDIEVIFDNTRSATTNYVVDSVLHGAKMGAKIMAAKTSKEVIDYVDQNPGSIGVIGSNWLNDRRDSTNTTFKKNIHVMRVSIKDVATPYNSWQPYQAYLLDGRYPFVRTLYAIVVDPHRALPWSFANYISGPRGQLILFKTGLLPYRGDITIKTVNVKR
jgi:phosphate transport system substrate-binding protein